MSTEPSSILTNAGWNSFVDRNCMHFAKQSIAKEFTFADLLLICNRNPITGTPFDEPMGIVVVTRFSDRDASKDRFVMVARAMSVAGNAVASIYASEMWFSMVNAATTEEMEELAKTQVAPGDDPNRKEGIIVQHEHRLFGAGGAMAIIETDPSGKRTVGPWDKQFDMGGRFSGLVGLNQIDDPSTLNLIRIYLKREITLGHISEIQPRRPQDIYN